MNLLMALTCLTVETEAGVSVVHLLSSPLIKSDKIEAEDAVSSLKGHSREKTEDHAADDFGEICFSLSAYFVFSFFSTTMEIN